MDIIAAYRAAGTFRGAADIAGTTHKTVKRAIARQEAGGTAPERAPLSHNYDGAAALVTDGDSYHMREARANGGTTLTKT